MNAIFFTQTSSLEMFYRLARRMRQDGFLGRVGFFVTDSVYFKKFAKKNPGILDFPLLKDWEITKQAKRTSLNLERLKEYEKQFGNPFLWSAVVNDRRLSLGKKSAFYQDYSPHYREEQSLSLLETGISQVQDFFDDLKPDFCLNFICVTLGEHLGSLIARKRNIPFFNLRPTRIKNYIYAADSIYEPPQSFVERYPSYQAGKVSEEVADFIAGFFKEQTFYEGTYSPETAGQKKEKKYLSFFERIRLEISYRFGELRDDVHATGFFFPVLFKKVIRPIKSRLLNLGLQKKYLKVKDLEKIEYAFYPLHKEPEYTLLLYNRFHLNQIEVIRNIAQSLPIGMKLLVKEHPVNVGYRPVSYYEKILKIPNVALIAPKVSSRAVIDQAKLVTVLGGSVGFEALILRKPVLMIGNALFQLVNSRMLTKVENLSELPQLVDHLLKNYEYDQQEIERYVSFIIENSVAVDLYSKLLRKNSAYSFNRDETYQDHLNRLKNYLISLLEKNRLASEVSVVGGSL